MRTQSHQMNKFKFKNSLEQAGIFGNKNELQNHYMFDYYLNALSKQILTLFSILLNSREY